MEEEEPVVEIKQPQVRIQGLEERTVERSTATPKPRISRRESEDIDPTKQSSQKLTTIRETIRINRNFTRASSQQPKRTIHLVIR